MLKEAVVELTQSGFALKIVGGKRGNRRALRSTGPNFQLSTFNSQLSETKGRSEAC
jgi:hypothetical protein